MGIVAKWKERRAIKRLQRAASPDAKSGMSAEDLLEKHVDSVVAAAATFDPDYIYAETERLTREWGTPEDVAILRLARPYLFMDLAHMERAGAHYAALTPEQIAIVDDSNARQMRIADRLLAHRRQEATQK